MGPPVTDLHPLPVPPDKPFKAEPDAVVILAHELPGVRDWLPTATPTGPSLSDGDSGFLLCVGQSVEFCADLPVRKPFDQGHAVSAAHRVVDVAVRAFMSDSCHSRAIRCGR